MGRERRRTRRREPTGFTGQPHRAMQKRTCNWESAAPRRNSTMKQQSGFAKRRKLVMRRPSMNSASFYFNGTGVPQDFAEAARWCKQAAEKGLLAAESTMSRLYIEGKGVPQDGMEGVKWKLKAAEHGDPTSQYNLGHLYLQ